jgi:hypothetical protein
LDMLCIVFVDEFNFGANQELDLVFVLVL